MSFESAKCAMQLVQRDGMQAALDANRALQTQLELVKDQLDKFVLDNEQQVASIQQLRVNPSAGKGENPDGLARSAIGPSRFWVKGDRVPDYNDDAVALLPYFSHLPHRFQHPPQWNAQDCSKLQKQVLMIVQVKSICELSYPACCLHAA
ncbi:hypothetical protein MMC14_008369 [Varicellaria rhodocarpa]|nr:hypothetical protein [Varicellaria rhodocarpa]